MFVGKIKMDYAPLLRRALRAIGYADVRSGILPPQSGLRRHDGEAACAGMTAHGVSKRESPFTSEILARLRRRG